MPIYRIVWRDMQHHITEVKDVECSSDEEATECAKQFVDGHDIELYQRGRFIAYFRSTEHRD